MNRRHILPWGFLLSFAILLSSCIQQKSPTIEDNSTQSTASTSVATVPDDTEATPVFIYQSMDYHYKTDVTDILSILTTNLDPAYLLLVNREHPLDSEFAPQQLTEEITCPTYRDKKISLESRVAIALYTMLAEMEADGVTDIAVTSGYRSYEYQEQLHRQYINSEKSGISPEAYAYFGPDYIQKNYIDQGLTRLTEEDALQVVQSYSAIPGASEHQSGLCVDFVTSNAMLSESFENTDAFQWLYQNAYRFGFILRYPSDKTQKTGFSYEPWHFRFVGREAATELYFRNLTLEELSEIF